LLTTGILSFAPLLGIATVGNLRQHLVRFVLLYGLSWCCYAVAVLLVVRDDARDRHMMLIVVLAIALAGRAVMLWTPPTLSDDLYRYVWEGEVWARGFSPYALAPSAPALAALRDNIWAGVNNPDVPSPYPALAQLISFLEASQFPHSVFGAKLTATIADLAVIAVLCLLLRAHGHSFRRVVIYAWNPLVLVEFPLSGHNDVMMLALLLSALAVGGRKPVRGGVLLGLAALAKFVPLVVVPIIWRAWGPRAAAVAAGVFFAVTATVLTASGALGSLPHYLSGFADNDSIHALVREVVALAAPSLAVPVAKVVTWLALICGVGLFVAAPRLRARPVWWQSYALFALTLVLAATVHAWYVTWLLPFLALNLRFHEGFVPLRPLPSVGWLLFSFLVALPYLTYADHVWRLWISFVEYVPLFAFLGTPYVMWVWQRRVRRKKALSPRVALHGR
jgi:hypothetical protein